MRGGEIWTWKKQEGGGEFGAANPDLSRDESFPLASRPLKRRFLRQSVT